MVRIIPDIMIINYIYYFLLCLLLLYMVERCLPHQKLVGKDSQAPQIHGHIVLRTLEYLRGRIVKSPTIGFSSLIAYRRPAKITKLTRTIRHYDILWLNISVGNPILMHVYYPLGYFFYLFGCVVHL